MNWISTKARTMPRIRPHDKTPTQPLTTSFFWPTTDESPESSDSDSASGSDGDGDDAAPHAKRESALASDLGNTSIDGVPLDLPQRPSLAVTRDERHGSPRHTPSTIRVCTPTKTSPRASPISNHGLPLTKVEREHPPVARPAPTQARSEDRIRAAQRLFVALNQSQRSTPQPSPTSAQTQTPTPAARPRIATLRGLTAQAQRRHSGSLHKSTQPAQDHHMRLTPTMHGTQHCVIATERSTFEFIVTPPTPRMDDHKNDENVQPQGIRFISHRTAQPPPSPSPSAVSLEPPPFELAPGRARQLALRRQQEQAGLALQQAQALASQGQAQALAAHGHAMPRATTLSTVPQPRAPQQPSLSQEPNYAVPPASGAGMTRPPASQAPRSVPTSTMSTPTRPVHATVSMTVHHPLRPVQLACHTNDTMSPTIRNATRAPATNTTAALLRSQMAYASPAGREQIMAQCKAHADPGYAPLPTPAQPSFKVAPVRDHAMGKGRSVVKYVPPGRRRLSTMTPVPEPLLVAKSLPR